MIEYVFVHRVADFGSFAEISSTYTSLLGHLPAHEIQSAKISFGGNTNVVANPASFVHARIYQSGIGGQIESGRVLIVESERIFSDVKSTEAIDLQVKKGAPFYMGALILELETKHAPGAGMSAPWKGIGDMVLTLHMKSKGW